MPARLTSVRIAIVLTAAAATVALLPAMAQASQADPSATPQVVTQYSTRTSVPVTGAEAQLAAAKTARATTYFTHAQANWKRMAAQPGSVDPAATPTSKSVPLTAFIQNDENWCGPTSLVAIADYLRVEGKAAETAKRWTTSQTSYTQESHAAKLVLDPAEQGTDWSGTNNGIPSGSWKIGYPMHDALNYLLRGSGHPGFYDVKALPNSPTSAQISYFKSELVYDANFGGGWPLAANEYAAPGYYLPNQHSSGIIMHWLAPNGYTVSGATTTYVDPGWGGGAIQHASTTSFVVALGGRGYVY